MWEGKDDIASSALCRELEKCLWQGFRPKAVQVETNRTGSVLMMISVAGNGGTAFHLDRADAYNVAIPLQPLEVCTFYPLINKYLPALAVQIRVHETCMSTIHIEPGQVKGSPWCHTINRQNHRERLNQLLYFSFLQETEVIAEWTFLHPTAMGGAARYLTGLVPSQVFGENVLDPVLVAALKQKLGDKVIIVRLSSSLTSCYD